jgi:hypothetical protein
MSLKMAAILLIGLDYHDYARAIATELVTQGHSVSFHSIQPGKPHLKLLRKFAPKFYQPALDRYHASLIEQERVTHYDVVLFIQVHQFSHANMTRLRSSQPGARFVLYNWDAVSTHDYTPYLRYFDTVHTFDPRDARRLGVRYLPLFCIRSFQDLPDRFESPLSVYFVGNIVSPERYRAVQAFRRYCVEQGISFRYFLSTTVHGLTQMLKQGIIPWDISLRSIPKARFIAMVEESAAVFDFANHHQAGYTMRVIENLCARKKLITNNPLIAQEAFISGDRAFVFQGLNFEGVKSFLETPLANATEVFREFHVQQFVQRLLAPDSPAMPRDSRP